jgi:hypothetical protein
MLGRSQLLKLLSPTPGGRQPRASVLGLLGALTLLGCGDDDNAAASGGPPIQRPDTTTGGERNPVCEAGESPGEVQEPVFWQNLGAGETSWFAAPIVEDLDGDGSRELVAAYYSLFVYDSSGELLDEVDAGEGRIYAPHVVADLEGDGTMDIVYGNAHEVYAFEWIDGALSAKAGCGRSGRKRQHRGRGDHDPDRGYRSWRRAGVRVLG